MLNQTVSRHRPGICRSCSTSLLQFLLSRCHRECCLGNAWVKLQPERLWRACRPEPTGCTGNALLLGGLTRTSVCVSEEKKRKGIPVSSPVGERSVKQSKKKKKTNGCSAGKEKRSVTEALRVEILFEFISMIDEQSRGVEKDMMEAWKFDGSEMGQVSQGCHQKLKVVRWSKRAALLFQWRTEISDGRNGERRKRNNQPPKEEQTGHERLFG